jgi:uncharacterized protein YegJ (DUF2314 family)
MKLPSYENDYYELDDVELIHNEYPDTYWIPAEEDRASLKKGDLVKLVFRMESREDRNEVSVERMWVEVQGEKFELYEGVLDNDPGSDVFVECGQKVFFKPKHVIQIYDE